MIRLAFVLCTSAALAAAQAPTPGFTITLDGDGYSNARLVLKPMNGTYANNYWISKRDPRITRIVLGSDPTVAELRFGTPKTSGTYVFDRSQEDSDDRNPYLAFELIFEKGADKTLYKPEHIEVTITRFDPPGGRIEGTFKGTVYRPLYRGSAIVTLNGTFSVVRVKDRVVD